MTIDLALDARAELGEGPIWDDARQCLLFVDIMRGHVHLFDPVTGEDRRFQAPEPTSVVVLTTHGDYVIGTKSGLSRIDPSSGAIAPLASIEADSPDNRMNDGAVDVAGRLWTGTMSMTGQPRGTLYRCDPSGAVTPMVRDVTVSNGIDWSLDGRLMYYADTATGRVDVFDFDAAAGQIANRRPFVEIPPDAGSPDGLIVDAEGAVWLALWGGGALRRYLSDGQLDRAISLPVTHPTKCAFGGADLGDLYVTSAWIDLPPEARAAQPQAGGVFRLRPGPRGRPPNRFAG